MAHQKVKSPAPKPVEVKNDGEKPIAVVNFCEDQLEALRKEKRKLDDKMADVKSLQREFDGLLIPAQLTSFQSSSAEEGR